MTIPSAAEPDQNDLGLPTLPENLSLTARGFATEEEARDPGTAVLDCVRILSRRFNLSRLDGITVAHGKYGDLLKFAAYAMGNADGHGVNLSDSKTLAHALSAHWFEPFINRLHEACRTIALQYGRWTDRAAFKVIGDLADELIAFRGITHHHLADGRLYLDIP